MIKYFHQTPVPEGAEIYTMSATLQHEFDDRKQTTRSIIVPVQIHAQPPPPVMEAPQPAAPDDDDDDVVMISTSRASLGPSFAQDRPQQPADILGHLRHEHRCHFEGEHFEFDVSDDDLEVVGGAATPPLDEEPDHPDSQVAPELPIQCREAGVYSECSSNHPLDHFVITQAMRAEYETTCDICKNKTDTGVSNSMYFTVGGRATLMLAMFAHEPGVYT